MKKFQRCIEDFTCKNCGQFVSGNGYTNHCPRCLYSLHVDESPGDRASHCGGLMEPVGVEVQKGEYILSHKCLTCGVTKRNRTAAADDFNVILEIMRKG
ncbi:MAG: RNHCP domain-containing protein [Spirochaetales bacterium]|nr:RNHCP domain-containing protein [Spirochaetales bacterium]